MDKYLLLTIIVAQVVLPAMFARDACPRRGLKRAITAVVIFNVVYLLALLFIYPQISSISPE